MLSTTWELTVLMKDPRLYWDFLLMMPVLTSPMTTVEERHTAPSLEENPCHTPKLLCSILDATAVPRKKMPMEENLMKLPSMKPVKPCTSLLESVNPNFPTELPITPTKQDVITWRESRSPDRTESLFLSPIPSLDFSPCPSFSLDLTYTTSRPSLTVEESTFLTKYQYSC